MKLEGGAVVRPQQPDRAAIGAQHGLHDGEPHPGAAAVPAGGEERIENPSRFCSEIGSPLLLTVSAGRRRPPPEAPRLTSVA